VSGSLMAHAMLQNNAKMAHVCLRNNISAAQYNTAEQHQEQQTLSYTRNNTLHRSTLNYNLLSDGFQKRFPDAHNDSGAVHEGSKERAGRAAR
jgi:hypothetical protein